MHHVELLSAFASVRQLFDEIYAKRGPTAASNAAIVHLLDASSALSKLEHLSTLLDAEVDESTLQRWQAHWRAYKSPMPLVASIPTLQLNLGMIWSTSDQIWLMKEFKPSHELAFTLFPPRIDWDKLIARADEQLVDIWQRRSLYTELRYRVASLAETRKDLDKSVISTAFTHLDEGFIRPHMLLLAITSFLICIKWKAEHE